MNDKEVEDRPSQPDSAKPARRLPWLTADEIPPPPPEMRRPPEKEPEPGLFDHLESEGSKP